VSQPWPARTKVALRTSLDEGTFEDLHLSITPGPGETECQLHFARNADKGVATSIPILSFLYSCTGNDTEISLESWQAFAYYVYTDLISFEPLGPRGTEPAAVRDPSDAQFRGYPCPRREVLYLARRLNQHSVSAACSVLVDRLSAEIVSVMTPENVVEEMFYGLPPPVTVIDRGVGIIRSNRHDNRIRSQLQEILEEAASGGRSENLNAFFACFNGLQG